MGKIEILNNVMSAIEQGNFKEAESFFSDDFTFSGPVPKPIGKSEYLELHKKLMQGIPDLKFNMSKLSESGNLVNGSVKLSGTQSKELPSLMPGVSAVPATNKKIQLPEENFAANFKGDKIISFTAEKVTSGGLPGLLKQLGVTVPAL